MPMYHPDVEALSPDKIRDLQEERLIQQVKYAYERVPMYEERFRGRHLHPDDIKNLEDISKVPFTYKDDLREHYPYGITAVPLTEIVRFHSSSGTTGIPTVVSYTKKDMEVWTGLMARCLAAAGLTSEDIVQIAYGYGLFTGGLGYHYGAERLGCSVVPIGSGNTKNQLRIMKDFRTTVICCTPTYALYLAEAAKQDGIDPHKDLALRIGMFGAEPWSEEQRKHIEESIGLKAMDLYGMSEIYGPGVAVECEIQRGLHIWGDEFYCETIDPESGEVLTPGMKGELVITMLNREAMPLLRYRTRDICTLNYDKCECGRTHPRIMRLAGRSDDMLIVRGVNVFPSQIESVIFDTPGASQQYEIIVDRDILDDLQLRVEVEPEVWESSSDAREAFSLKLRENLKTIMTIDAKVQLVAPGSIPRSEGKAKRVTDLRKETG